MHADNYSIAEPLIQETTIAKSRFLAHLFPTDTVADAKAAITKTKKLHLAASHNCSAYIIHHDTILQKSNDDGEPAGTAGAPMLQALNERSMINITAVVTRYFGGIKLGAGGLIRAYARAVLNALDAAQLMVYKSMTTFALTISYEELNAIYLLQAKTKLFTIEAITYEPTTTIHIAVETDKRSLLETALQAQLLRTAPLSVVQIIIKKVPYIV